MITAEKARQITDEHGTLIDDILKLIEIEIVKSAQLGKRSISYHHEKISWRNDYKHHSETEPKMRLIQLLTKRLYFQGFKVISGNGMPYRVGMDEEEFTNSTLEISW